MRKTGQKVLMSDAKMSDLLNQTVVAFLTDRPDLRDEFEINCEQAELCGDCCTEIFNSILQDNELVREYLTFLFAQFYHQVYADDTYIEN